MVINPSNESIVDVGDIVRCSVGHNVTSAVNYKWIDSATGHVIHHGDEWTVKPCPHQSYDYTGHRSEVMDNCATSTDGLLMLECHVTVGMATTHQAVALYLKQPETTFSTVSSSKSGFSYIFFLYFNHLYFTKYDRIIKETTTDNR